MYRYLPIFITDVENVNISLGYRNVNISLPSQQLSEIMEYNITTYPQQPNTSYVYIILYVFIILFSILIIYIMLLYFRSRVPGSSPYISIYRDRGSGIDLFTYGYVYEGLAKMLRELFVNIRDRFCGRYCTPRETALKLSSARIMSLFAEIYEDVVYGMKLRLDAVDIVNEVKKYLGENQ